MGLGDPLRASLGTGRSVVGLIALLAAAGSLVWPAGTAGAAGATVTISPTPAGARFTDAQSVKVSVGPNGIFVPHSRVVILECADPGGDASHLPVSLGTCDGNTVQPDTVLVQGDGSFSEASYTLYALPSLTLGEQANWQPVCNTHDQCVLFVGADQNDFTKPKAFSQPFTIGGQAAAATAPTTTPTTTPAKPVTTPDPAVSAAVTLAPATLAYTGAPGWLPGMVASGVALVLVALAGRRVVRRMGR
jgi:hypothetical protein